MTDKKVLTYVDADVLIAAARGNNELHEKAMAILDDPAREFVASDFLRLEVLPKAIYNKFKDEADFYEAFFEAVSIWAKDLPTIVSDSYEQAKKYGLNALDSLHVASVVVSRADELITGEKPTTRLNTVSSVKVITIRR